MELASMKDLMGRATTVGKWLTSPPKTCSWDRWSLTPSPHLTELQVLRHKSWQDCVNAIVYSVWMIGNGKLFYQYRCRIRVTPQQQQCFCSRLEIKVEVKRWQEQWINCCQDSHSSSPCFSPFCRLPWSRPTALQVAGGQTWDLSKSLHDRIFGPKIYFYKSQFCRQVSQNQSQSILTAASVNVLSH